MFSLLNTLHWLVKIWTKIKNLYEIWTNGDSRQSKNAILDSIFFGFLQMTSARHLTETSASGASTLAYGLWGKGLMWLIGAVVCLWLWLHHSSICSLEQAMDGHINAPRYH